MDPLSITASAIAIVQLSGAIINTCYNYRNGVKSASKDACRIINELNSLRTVIEDLFQLLEDEHETKSIRESTLSKLSRRDGALTNCEAVLRELSKKLEPKAGWRATKAAILWPLRESDMRKVLQEIDRAKSTIQLALDVDQRRATTIIQETVMSLHQRVSTDGLRARREKIFTWLDATSAIGSHEAARQKYRSGTGQWFLDGDIFQTWSSCPNSFLWIHGIVGCGKTILCSTIIEELSTLSQTDDETAVAYFYFDFNDSRKSKADASVRAMIAQLFCQTTHISPALENLFTQSRDGAMQPLLADLLIVLSQMIQEFRTVYLIIDALDECTELDDILELLLQIKNWNNKHLHVMASSRWNTETENSLSNIATAILCLDQRAMDRDISLYITSQLEKEPSLAQWPLDVQETIRETLLQGSRGMFRWVFCQLDMLSRSLTLYDLQKQLKALPRTLYETYDQILLRIDEAHLEKSRRVLEFLAFAARPVTFAEAAEVLAFDLDREPFYNVDRKLRNSEDLMLLCSTLVTRSPSPAAVYDQAKDRRGRHHYRYSDKKVLSTHYNKYNTYNLVNIVYKDSWIIRLAHLSVKDYLLSDRIKSTRLSYFSIDTRLSNNLIAQLCLVYFMQEEFSVGHCNWATLQKLLQEWPLFHYAANFWPYHVKASGPRLDERTWTLLQHFLDTRKLPKSGNYGAWIAALVPDAEHARKTHPLYYAASFGVTSLMKRIIYSEPGLNIDALGGGCFSTALHVAVYRNHPEAVKVLLEAGANPMTTNCFGKSCLYFAIGSHYAEVQGMLLDHGALLTEKDVHALRKLGIRLNVNPQRTAGIGPDSLPIRTFPR